MTIHLVAAAAYRRRVVRRRRAIKLAPTDLDARRFYLDVCRSLRELHGGIVLTVQIRYVGEIEYVFVQAQIVCFDVEVAFDVRKRRIRKPAVIGNERWIGLFG